MVGTAGLEPAYGRFEYDECLTVTTEIGGRDGT